MGHCSRCGQPLVEGNAFCGTCGLALAPAHQQSYVQPPGLGYAPLPPGYATPLPPNSASPPLPAPGYATPPPPDSVGQAPQFSFRLPVTTQDALLWLRGAGALLVVTLAAGFVLAFLVGLLLPSGNHGNPADWFSIGFVAAGMALGARVGVSGGSFDAGDGSFGASFDLRISALIITVAVLLWVRRLARLGEVHKPSATLRDLTLRALGTGVLFAVAMAILALAVHIHSVYGYNIFGGVAVDGSPTSPGTLSVGGSVGALVLSAGSVFLWPLLLVTAVWWGSAFAVWLRAGATTRPNPTAQRMAWLWTCRPAFLAVRAQLLATAVLAGVGTYVYAVTETLQQTSTDGSDSAATTRIVLALLLGLPNLAALAGTVSLGVPITGFGPLGSVLGVVGNIDPTNIDPNSTGGTPYTSTLSVAGSTSFGFFGDQHPAVLYALIAASVLGTLGAAKWTVDKSWDRSRALLGPGQAWRGAVVGALLWLVVGFAARLMENTSVMDMGTNLSIGPSLAGLLLAGAIWGLATCLAMSYFAGHLTATPVMQSGPVGPGTAGFGNTSGVGGVGGATVPPQSGSSGSSSSSNSDDDVIDMGTVITIAAYDPEE